MDPKRDDVGAPGPGWIVTDYKGNQSSPATCLPMHATAGRDRRLPLPSAGWRPGRDHGPAAAGGGVKDEAERIARRVYPCDLSLTDAIRAYGDARAQAERERCADVVRGYVSACPESMFPTPALGQHGETVDVCSAATLRAVLPSIIDEILHPPDPTSCDAATTAAPTPATEGRGRGVPQDGPPASSLQETCPECGSEWEWLGGQHCPNVECARFLDDVEREKGGAK
jgi:hypothetical protein